MIFGMSVFTFVHVLTSLVAIGSGLIVLYAFFRRRLIVAITIIA